MNKILSEKNETVAKESFEEIDALFDTFELEELEDRVELLDAYLV